MRSQTNEEEEADSTCEETNLGEVEHRERVRNAQEVVLRRARDEVDDEARTHAEPVEDRAHRERANALRDGKDCLDAPERERGGVVTRAAAAVALDELVDEERLDRPLQLVAERVHHNQPVDEPDLAAVRQGHGQKAQL